MARAMHLSTTGFNALVGFGNCPGGTWKGHDLEIIPVWCREKMRQHGLNGQTWTTIYTYICIHIKFEVWILNRISQIFFWLINSFRLIPLIWDWQSWHADRELLILLWISIRKSHDLKFLSQHCSNQRFYPMDNTVFLHCISKTWFVFLEFLSRIHFLFFFVYSKKRVMCFWWQTWGLSTRTPSAIVPPVIASSERAFATRGSQGWAREKDGRYPLNLPQSWFSGKWVYLKHST